MNTKKFIVWSLLLAALVVAVVADVSVDDEKEGGNRVEDNLSQGDGGVEAAVDNNYEVNQGRWRGGSGGGGGGWRGGGGRGGGWRGGGGQGRGWRGGGWKGGGGQGGGWRGGGGRGGGGGGFKTIDSGAESTMDEMNHPQGWGGYGWGGGWGGPGWGGWGGRGWGGRGWGGGWGGWGGWRRP